MRPSPYDVIGAVADIRRGEGRQLMQRYDLVEVTYQVYYTDHEMEKYDEGEWVKYDDVAARIAELEADRDRDRLATIVERARNGDPQLIDGIEDFMAAEAAAEETE